MAAVFGDREEAIQLGRTFNQIAIYDLEQEVEIDIGGTGEEIPELPPDSERLSPLKRGQQE